MNSISLRKITEYKPTESEPISFNDIVGIREKTFAIQAALETMPQATLKLIHHFSPGVYARELHIPADCTLVGEIHKYPQLNILSKGKLQVLLEDGVKEIEAPFTVISPAGTKRVAYAHTDCVWTTILATDLKNVEEIEKYFIAKTEEEWLEFNNLAKSQLEFKDV